MRAKPREYDHCRGASVPVDRPTPLPEANRHAASRAWRAPTKNPHPGSQAASRKPQAGTPVPRYPDTRYPGTPAPNLPGAEPRRGREAFARK